MEKIVIGSRASKLALWQTNYVAACIRERYPNIIIEIKTMLTSGDKILDVPLAKIGGKGLFTKELEHAMLGGEIDLAVHSLKDMPTTLPKGLIISAVTERHEPFDALVSHEYKTIDALPHGARIGTSSLRRKAQLLSYRPDLTMVDLRGNVDTRLRKLTESNLDAIVLAAAGLKRLGYDEYITQVLPKEICLPAVGQGALAIESRNDDNKIVEIIKFLNDEKTNQATEAERAFLSVIEGGCQVPVGVFGEVNERLTVHAVIASLDGKRLLKDNISGCPKQAAALGIQLAKRMLAQGGDKILAGIMQ